MAHVIGYHRPTSVEAALEALASPGATRVIVGGGTAVNAGTDHTPVEVVDLQALGLDTIDEEPDGRVRLGATTSLDAVAGASQVPLVLADLARREAPGTLRTMGTVGGLVARGDPESELLAGLLVHEATVTIVDQAGSVERLLTEVLDSGPGRGIITGLAFDPAGRTAVARTGRTPGDRPIVAAIARRRPDGTVLTALCGVAGTPVLIASGEALDPPGDFRGSAGYRRHLAATLLSRVEREVS